MMIVMTQLHSSADVINVNVTDTPILAIMPPPVPAKVDTVASKIEKTDEEKEADRQKEKERMKAIYEKHFRIDVKNEYDPDNRIGFHDYTDMRFEVFPDIDNNETILLGVQSAAVLRNDFNVCMTHMAHTLNTTYTHTFASNQWAFQKVFSQTDIQKALAEYLRITVCNNCYQFDTHMSKDGNNIWHTCNWCKNFEEVSVPDDLKTKLLMFLQSYRNVTVTYEYLERAPAKEPTAEELKFRKDLEDVKNGIKPEPVASKWAFGGLNSGLNNIIGGITNYWNNPTHNRTNGMYSPTVSTVKPSSPPPGYQSSMFGGNNYSTLHPQHPANGLPAYSYNSYNAGVGIGTVSSRVREIESKVNNNNKQMKYTNSITERYRKFAQDVSIILNDKNHTVHEIIRCAENREVMDEAIVAILMRVCNEKILDEDQLNTNRKYIQPFVTDKINAQVNLIMALETFLNKYYIQLHNQYSKLLDAAYRLGYLTVGAFEIAVKTTNVFMRDGSDNRRSKIRTMTDDYYSDLINDNGTQSEYEVLSNTHSSDDDSDIIDLNLPDNSQSHDVLPPYRDVTYTYLTAAKPILG